jgi:hypothetical protein
MSTHYYSKGGRDAKENDLFDDSGVLYSFFQFLRDIFMEKNAA